MNTDMMLFLLKAVVAGAVITWMLCRKVNRRPNSSSARKQKWQKRCVSAPVQREVTEVEASAPEPVKPCISEEKFRKLEAASALAEVDVEYLEPIVNDLEERLDYLNGLMEMMKQARTDPSEAQLKKLQITRRDYYSALKKLLKAKNTVEEFDRLSTGRV